MSFIVRTGNLARTPQLREGENGVYTYARVLVSDSIRREDGTYEDGPLIAYDISVSGSQAVNLVETAEECGNVRVMFAGKYRVSQWSGEQGIKIKHEVRASEIAISLRGQSIRVQRAEKE